LPTPVQFGAPDGTFGQLGLGRTARVPARYRYV